MSGNLAMELGNSGGGFDMLELGLDMWAEVLGSSTVHWHSWEQYSDKGWNLIRLGVIWIHWGKILESGGWILVRQN